MLTIKKKKIKIEERERQFEKKTTNTQVINSFIEEYGKFNNSEILDMSKGIVSDLKKTTIPSEINILECKLTSLKFIIDHQLMESDGKSIPNNDFYPELTDKDFNQKIFYKKEFLINRYPKKNKKG